MNNTYRNYINASWKESSTKEILECISPLNEGKMGSVQRSTSEDVDLAVEAAKNAQKEWKKLSGKARGDFLFKIANKIEKRKEEIAETLTEEMGKPIGEALGETTRGIDILKYFAGEGMRKTGDVIPASDNTAFMYTDRIPVGVVGLITPWNFPVAIPIWKIAPAIIYGNTVVFKPASESAITAAKIMECVDEAGLPNGVVNMVTGQGSVVGERIIQHPDIKALSFTGSNNTGADIGKKAAARGVKYQLEMGGKNPLIVADDANLDDAVNAAISGGFGSTGQKCTATSRIIVQAGIYEEFKNKLVEKTKNLKIGDALNKDNNITPVVSKSQLNNVMHYVEKGKNEGANILTGGNQLEQKGFYIEPTIFEHVKSEMTIGQEEIFGPVLALIKVNTIEEALNIANDIEFGLSASIFTKNTENMFEFIEDIDAGLVRVNFETAGVELQAPFGGMKDSSYGPREQGQAAQEFYTNTKTVFIKP